MVRLIPVKVMDVEMSEDISEKILILNTLENKMANQRKSYFN